MKPKEKARLQIGHLLEAAGWQVQSRRNLNLGASLGVAVQSGKYTAGIPKDLPHVLEPLPFAYESTGTETLSFDKVCKCTADFILS